jgi:hypothetical protein
LHFKPAFYNHPNLPETLTLHPEQSKNHINTPFESSKQHFQPTVSQNIRATVKIGWLVGLKFNPTNKLAF